MEGERKGSIGLAEDPHVQERSKQRGEKGQESCRLRILWGTQGIKVDSSGQGYGACAA